LLLTLTGPPKLEKCHGLRTREALRRPDVWRASGVFR
jgi:hypothetical protein